LLKTGSLAENTHISIVINDFHAIVKPLARQPASKSNHEIALRHLAIQGNVAEVDWYSRDVESRPQALVMEDAESRPSLYVKKGRGDRAGGLFE